MERGSSGRKWFDDAVQKEASNDAIELPNRLWQVISIGCILAVFVFVIIHQTRPTGFFTSEFGTLGAVLLYGAILLGIPSPFVRLLAGSKNKARPFELVSMAVFFIAQIWLLAVFPFNFSHFAEPLPNSLEFLLEWVSPLIAKWVLGVGIFGAFIGLVYTYFLYRGVTQRLAAGPPAPPPEPAHQ